MGALSLLRYVASHPLNADAKAAALGRVIRWQIGSRLLPGPVALPYVGGTRLFTSRGMMGATGNWYCGLHESNEMGFVLYMLRDTDHFVDVGANVGSYTVLASGCTGAKTTAVEPIPSTFAHLTRNVLLNGLGDLVRCWQGGLSDVRGTLRFSSELDTINHVLSENENVSAVNVPVIRLDDLVGDDIPTVIKIDVEGHERAVLLGAKRVLADSRLQSVIMETNGSGARYGISDDDLIGLMDRNGFGMFEYEPLSRSFSSRKPSLDGNTLFVRDIEKAKQRTSSAPRFSLVNGSI